VNAQDAPAARHRLRPLPAGRLRACVTAVAAGAGVLLGVALFYPFWYPGPTLAIAMFTAWLGGQLVPVAMPWGRPGTSPSGPAGPTPGGPKAPPTRQPNTPPKVPPPKPKTSPLCAAAL